MNKKGNRMQGTIAQVYPPDSQDGYNNHYQTIVISTQHGPITGVKASQQPLTQNDVGKQIEWDVTQAHNKVRGTYNKFTTPKALYGGPYQAPSAQGQQYAPQNAQQGPQQPAQRPNGTKGVDWDAKDLRNARMNGLNNATALVCLMGDLTEEASIEMCERIANRFVAYIYKGPQHKPVPGPQRWEDTNLSNDPEGMGMQQGDDVAPF